MNSEIEIKSGGFWTRDKKSWYWPKKDRGAWDWMCMEPHLPSKVLAHTKERNNCLIAGAHCGFYAKQYSYEFSKVFAFEPHPTNFECLVLNVPDTNVFKAQLALSQGSKFFGLETVDQTNSGGYYLKEGSDCFSLTLDSLSVELDLLHLDVEGHELEVLIGGTKMLSYCTPVIILENTYPLYQEAEKFLISLGYSIVEILRFDTIFKKIGVT